MEFKPGMLVSPATRCVDLCPTIALYSTTTIFERGEVGIVVETHTATPDVDEHRFVKVLSPSGISGWCLEKFLCAR